MNAFPASLVTGVDSSSEMIQAASLQHAAAIESGKVNFRLATIENEIKNKSTYDVVYSNAALHWCIDHKNLFPSIINMLSPDEGILAVQMPDTIQQSSHTLMIEAAANIGLGDVIRSVRIPRAEHSAEQYYGMLAPFCKHIDIWTTEYLMELECGTDAAILHPVLEFTAATGLKPILNAINNHAATGVGGSEQQHGGRRADLQEQSYLAEYQRLLQERYPSQLSSSLSKRIVLAPYRRIFIICRV
jgi:trans-aconitate 2-methyltransferase